MPRDQIEWLENKQSPLPAPGGETTIMPDGGVYVTASSRNIAAVYYPDEMGNYSNGYWTPVMNDAGRGLMHAAVQQIGPDGNVWKMGGHPGNPGEYDMVKYDHRSKKHTIFKDIGGVRHQGNAGHVRFDNGRITRLTSGLGSINPITFQPETNSLTISSLGSTEAGWAKTPYGFVHFYNNLGRYVNRRPAWYKVDSNFQNGYGGIFPLFNYEPTKWRNCNVEKLGVETNSDIEFSSVIWYPKLNRVVYLCNFGELVGFNPLDDSVEILTHVDYTGVNRIRPSTDQNDFPQWYPLEEKTMAQIQSDGFVDLIYKNPVGNGTSFNETRIVTWNPPTPWGQNIIIYSSQNGRHFKFRVTGQTINGSTPVTGLTTYTSGSTARVYVDLALYGDQNDVSVTNLRVSGDSTIDTYGYVQVEGWSGVTPQGALLTCSPTPFNTAWIWSGSNTDKMTDFNYDAGSVLGVNEYYKSKCVTNNDLGITWLPTGQLINLLHPRPMIWTPSGQPDVSQKPIIDSAPEKIVPGSKYQISGRQLWGTHVGLHQNDDTGLDCNHPIFSLHAPDGRVYFTPWTNSSSASIAPLIPSTIEIDIPETVPAGRYTLRCSSAGNVSEEREIQVTNSIGGSISINQYY